MLQQMIEVPKRQCPSLGTLMDAVARKTGYLFPASAFDTFLVPPDLQLDPSSPASFVSNLDRLVFVEQKVTGNPKVGKGFDDFFLTITANQRLAQQALGAQYVVMLLNTLSGEREYTTVDELFERAANVWMRWALRLGPKRRR